jgi:hypothetical protein
MKFIWNEFLERIQAKLPNFKILFIFSIAFIYLFIYLVYKHELFY